MVLVTGNLSAVCGRDQAMMVSLCLSSASQASNFRLVDVAQLQTPLDNHNINNKLVLYRLFVKPTIYYQK